MKKWLKILLSQNNLRKALGFQTYKNALDFNHHLEMVDKLSFKNVLVLAPHPDDDIFGPGGTLAKLAKDGAKIRVAYFCDGAAGLPENGKTTKDLVSRRENEAKIAGKLLGFDEQIFYRYPDGKLCANSSAEKALFYLIKRVKPDIIFLPSLIDNHPDHRAVNDILAKVLGKIGQFKTEIWSYEIWTTIFPNRIVKINKMINLKKEAMAAHQSQLESRGYQEAILGLNQYRAQINGLEGYAEAFWATTPEIYLKFYQNN